MEEKALGGFVLDEQKRMRVGMSSLLALVYLLSTFCL
jgi:hypothetical protein